MSVTLIIFAFVLAYDQSHWSARAVALAMILGAIAIELSRLGVLL